MHNFFAICKLTFKEGVSHRLLYGVFIMAILVMPVAVLVSGFFMRDISKIMVDFCLSAVSLGGLLVPFFLAVAMLAGDIERRTIFSLLSRPISRRAYLLGKFGGLALLTGLVMLFIGVAGLAAVWTGNGLYGSSFFTSFHLSAYLTAMAMNFLAIMLLNSLVVLWCSLTTSSLLATLLTLASYLIGQTIDDIVSLIEIGNPQVPVTPLFKYMVQTGKYIFPNLAAFDFKQVAAYGLPIPISDVAFLCLYCAGYSAAILSLAICAFNRRDLA